MTPQVLWRHIGYRMHQNEPSIFEIICIRSTLNFVIDALALGLRAQRYSTKGWSSVIITSPLNIPRKCDFISVPWGLY